MGYPLNIIWAPPYCAEKQRVGKLATELAESKEGLKQVVDTLNELKSTLVMMSRKAETRRRGRLTGATGTLKKHGAAVLVRSWMTKASDCFWIFNGKLAGF